MTGCHHGNRLVYEITCWDGVYPTRIDLFPKCSFYPVGELPERNASVAIVKPWGTTTLFLLLHGVDMEVTKNDYK